MNNIPVHAASMDIAGDSIETEFGWIMDVVLTSGSTTGPTSYIYLRPVTIILSSGDLV